ncbi:eIF-2-alpha kinase GCN2 [Sesamum alatum]|uniref:EIF-2-alpha kinase GCN2 n=1 Tax=Sesamum alatum TaxID=300844 RepID=A0AAE1YE66_9LAMI|nr:eIF-2-alpha kinase GCN2 [Sesamum alatum]
MSFWEGAFEGDLRSLIQFAEERDTGGGLAHTLATLRDEKGKTALHVAAERGKNDFCEYLLNQTLLSPDIVDSKERTRCATPKAILPCTMLLKQIVELLLANSASIDAESDYGTPLQRAIAYRKKDVVKLLLDRGADPNLDSQSFTPLLYSIFANSVGCMELLLKAGADSNIGIRAMTPIGLAKSYGMTRLVDCLLNHGIADTNPVQTSLHDILLPNRLFSSNNSQPSTDSGSSGGEFVPITSHYYTEFEEQGIIGTGGFGEVFKCQHFLDKMIYAVKKIPFNGEEEKRKCLREVQTIARLEHPHVIRYYMSWIEDRIPTKGTSSGSEEGTCGGSVDETCDAAEDEMFGSFEHERLDTVATKTLYIVMELCPWTLEKVILSGLDEKALWAFMRQIVEGLRYIHKEGIIHRDLSRDNIFVDKDNKIRIADFGLAVHLEPEEDVYIVSESSASFGNAMYRPPEMNADVVVITQKSDVYQLGLICFEMLYPTKTGQERIKVFSDVKEGVFPKDWVHDRDITLFILGLLDQEPAKRPSTDEILGSKGRCVFGSLVGSESSHNFGTLRTPIGSCSSPPVSKLIHLATPVVLATVPQLPSLWLWPDEITKLALHHQRQCFTCPRTPKMIQFPFGFLYFSLVQNPCRHQRLNFCAEGLKKLDGIWVLHLGCLESSIKQLELTFYKFEAYFLAFTFYLVSKYVYKLNFPPLVI